MLFSAIQNRFRAVISCLDTSWRVETTLASVALTRYDYGATPVGAEYDVVGVPPNLADGGEPAAELPSAPATSDQVVDVLILCTSAVRQALQSTGINVQQYMQDTLDTTQLAMDRSTTPGEPVIAELHLARAQEVARVDTGSNTADLEYLSNDPIPMELRNYWLADLVVLVRETSPDPNLCGLANVPGDTGGPPPGPAFAPYAVAVTKRICSFSGYPFQHEFGHLFGANHNPEVNGNTTPLEPWVFAH